MACPQSDKENPQDVVFIPAFELWKRKQAYVTVVKSEQNKGSAPPSQPPDPRGLSLKVAAEPAPPALLRA